MTSDRNEIEQFIYQVCYKPMWEKVAEYVAQHPCNLDLKFSKIKYPDAATLMDMLFEFALNTRINDDHLLFDAVVSCTIDLSAEDHRGPSFHDISQWFILSCEAVVTDQLKSFEVKEFRQYKERSRKATSEQAVSKNIVPIIPKKDLDNVATDFLTKFCPEALEQPMPIPISEIAENMGLQIIQGYRISDDFSIFGEIFFSEGIVPVQDLFKSQTKQLKVSRGTILIDTYTFWERNLGCVKNTIAHEVFHWYKHRMYAAIKQILHNKKIIACRCPTESIYPRKRTQWTDEQIMEWQANSIAPRILMPYYTFCQKVDELYSKYSYHGLSEENPILINIVNELANFYGVSKQSTLIRMIETGYKEAAGIYQYNKTNNFFSYIKPDAAFYIYTTDAEFRRLIESDLFKYVNGYFIINDVQYIQKDEAGQYFLTDFAWANLDQCTLKFTWTQITHQQINNDIFHRKNKDVKLPYFDAFQNKDSIHSSEEGERYSVCYERQNAIIDITINKESCWQAIYAIIQYLGISKAHFCELTHLGEEVYRKAKNDVPTNPSLRTIVAIALGLNLNLEITENLLKLAGHAFSKNNEHKHLKFCIIMFFQSAHSIDDANEFLKYKNLKPLGTIQRL